MKNIFIVGAKNCGAYGGYETFLDKLTEYHQDNKNIMRSMESIAAAVAAREAFSA